MPSITELPCEIVATILRNLDHLRFLCPALLTCRHFYLAFKESHGVEASILRRQITPALLPHAVAVMEASRLPRPLVNNSVDVLGLLDELYGSPARLASRVSALPTPTVRSMGRTHDAIHGLATSFANSAQERIPPSRTSTVLSPTEYFRFCRAFYRVELFYALFRDGDFDDNMNPWFCWRHHLWENEQVGSVYEYLEERFVQASHDVVAHDVDFGEMGIDYLEIGADNRYTQGWLSHGVELVYKLTIADSYDAKHRMLQDTVDVIDSEFSLPEALQRIIDFNELDTRKLVQYSDAELHSIRQRHGDEAEDDTDQGPYEAWREANKYRWLEDSCMFSESAWLRERAYVFWDADRLRTQKHGFGDNPGGWPDYTKAEYEEMIESFYQRSKIWQKGGKGYWSKNDTSRVVWP